VLSDVDLTGVETLGGIVAAINSQATGVTASINSARNGIQLADATGATASNFIVADGDATNSATALNVAINSSATSVNSGGLQRKVISAATLLSSLNGGAGIDVGDFKITGTNGTTGAVDLDKTGEVATTVGDVIARINALVGVGVEARINDRGDGIELVDTVGGSGTIKVLAVGNDTTAKDLRLLGTSVEKSINGLPTQVIDGTATSTVTIDSDDKLSDVVTKINALDAGVTASILNDGTLQRLSISADKSGAANAFLFDTSNSSIALEQISAGQDAVVAYGSTAAGGVLIGSSTNTFSNIVSGLDLTLVNGSQKPVTVNVSASSAAAVSGAKEFVAAYNSLQTTLDKATSFNAEDLTTGILFGTNTALRVDNDLAQVVTARFFGAGQFESLCSVGISLDDKGQMKLDEAKFTAAFNKDSAALKNLFTDDKRGVAKKLNEVVERLAGEENSLLTTRTDSLTDLIEANTKRLELMTDSLARQRERLLLTFYNLETTVSKLQDNLSALSSLQVIPPLTK
jgi:flagellar hook-associated protein 2